MDKLRALYDKLSSDGLYTKTFEEFEQQFSDPNSQRRLYDKLSSDGLYTKTSEEFEQQFFSASQPDIAQEIKDEFAEDPIREAVKKKDVTESVSEDGSLESQRKSKEIFEQISGPSWRVSEEEMPLTEQGIAQMESPVDEAPSRRDIGTIQAVDFTGDRFDFQAEKEIEARKTEDLTEEEKDRRIVEEMFAVAKRDSPETEEAVRDEIITGQELEAYKRKKEKFEKDIDDVVKQGKREKIFQYNIIAAEQGLEPISEAEYVILFEGDEKSAEDLDKEIFDEISNQLEEIGLTQEEVDAIDEKNRQLVANGQEPVDYDFYITQKKNNLFNQYIRSQGALPSQRKEAVTQSIIDADARILAPSSYGDIFDTTIDLTQGLDDKTRSERSEEIYKNKLKRNFIITNIPSEKFLQNANTLLSKEAYDEVVKEANENFYNNYGEQEWDAYTKISGNTDPTLMGTEYENDNQDNSLVNQAVVIDDEDATVENLQRLFPNSSFRFEATGIKDDYITISTVSPNGEVVKALEIYLGEENDPARRVREFMQGALLTKKDKAFLNKQYDYEDPLWRLEMYDYMLSNPQKFGEKGSPAMYGTKRAYETVDFKEIGDYLDTYKEDIPDETIELMRAKMSYAESYYSGELAQKGTLTTALTSGLLTGLSAPSRFVSNRMANIADVFGAEGAKEAKDGVISAIESAQEQISGTTTESIAERDLLGTLINTMASSGTAMVLGMGNPYATFGSFLMQSSPATERLLKDEDIPEYQKGLISILMGSVEGALETYGAQTLLTPSSKGVFKRLIIDSIKDLPSDAPQELIERAIKNSIRLKLKSGALQVAEGMAVEAATEAQQAQLEDLNKRLFNAIYEKEIFQVPDWTTEEGRKQWAEQIIESAKIGALSGGGFAVSIHGTKSLAKGFQDKADNNRFNKTYNEVMNNSAFNEAKRNFQKQRKENKITEQELELLNNQLDESREIMQSIPSALSTNRKRQAYNLLTEKRAIERVMQNKSPELVASQKDRIKSIDAQLKIVGNEEVAETADVVEEFVKDKPSRMERVTRYQEIDNIMKPEQVETTTEKIVREEAPVTEQVVEETTVTEKAPVVEEALETQPITKITNDLVAKEKKGELTQEETDGVLLGIMQKIEAENAKRKSPLSPEQAQKKLGKMQQRIFEANKDRYLELSGVMPAAQEQVTEEVVEEAPSEATTEEEVQEKPRFEDSKVPVGRKTFTVTNSIEGTTRTYAVTEYLDGSEGNFREILEDGDFTNTKNFGKLKSFKDIKEVLEKDEAVSVEITKEGNYKEVMNPKMFDKLTTDQQQRVDSERAKTKTKEAPKRKRRKKKAPVVKEEVKVSEEVTTPISKPKVVVSGTSDGYKVVSSSNTTKSENESIKDARGDKTFDKDGFRITKLEDGSSQVSYKSKVNVIDKGGRPGYAMATVIIPEGSPINKQQIQEAFDDKLSEIIESNRKKKLGTKLSNLTPKQNQQLTDAVVNSLSQEQVADEAPVKKAPVKKEAQVSEQVQKEIKRAEGTRDSIVGPLKTKLDRTRGFEQKEEIRDEIRQAEKKYNNIITELKEGKRTQFQVKETQENKTDASRYQEFVSVLKRSFPSVEVVTTQAEFDTLLKETGAKQLTTKNQKVYGAVYQGKLYLNPSLANYNTPIHEFGHVWMNVAKEANPELYEKGISLVKGSKYEQQVRNNPAYKDSTEQEILEEALATAIGDKGESFVSASQKKSFKDWLSTLYGFVRKLTGISKYTSKQLEDITLDEFTQAVAVDLLSGRQLFESAEITDMGDVLQLMAEKGVDLDAAMNESINQMIDKGFKAAEIKGVLLQMGYKARAINDALVVKIDADMKLPNEFANIEGGVKNGEALFRSVMQKLKEFAAPKLVKRSIKEQYNEAKKDGYEGTIKEYTEEQNNKKVEMLKEANPLLTLLTNEEILKRYPNIQNEVVEKQQKSRAEIRAKAIQLLEAEAAFQAQDNLTRLELINSMDRTMKTRSNKEVQKRISAIKQTLKGVREGVKDLQAAKKRIKNFINEELLPNGVSVRDANKLVRIVEKATKETYESSVAEVMKVVEAQTSKKKKETINKMLKLAQQKSKVTNKRARTDTDARRFFEQAVVVLKALDSKDTKSLEDIQSKLIKNEEKIYEILDALNDGLEVNDTDRNLSALAQAFDILGSLNNQDLSQHEDALNLMKSELESGMESLRTKRAARKAVYDKLREEANKNIKEGYEFLFDKDGQALSPSELENLSDELKQEMWNKITSIPKLLNAVNNYTKLQAQNFGKFSTFTDSVKNLGTLLRGLDKSGKFFEKNFFDKLNRMEEDYLQGYFNTMDILESELNSIGIKGGVDGLNKIINKEFVIAKTLDLKDIKLDLKKRARPVVKLTRGEAMRIYALSKNAEQMKRLKAQGFNEAKMQKIEEFIGPQLVKAVDITVDFLSTSYFEGINKVYEDVNDISLPYIENYFPTKTVPSKSSDAAEFDRLSKEMKSGNFAGVFSAQQASALKERTSKDAVDIKYQDFSSTLEEHIRTMERFKAYAMGTKEINIIINHTPSVKALLQVTNLQKTISDRTMAAINPNAAQQLFESSKGGKAFTFFQRQFTGITLALKPIQVLKQMSSFINAWEDYSLRGQEKRIPIVDTVLDALGFSYDIAVTFILLPKVWGKYSTYNKAMYSASFKDRIRQSFKTADLLGLEAGVGARRRSKKTRLGRALRRAKVVANSPTLVGDIAGVMGYMAAYRANMRNGMSQKEAIEKFNAYNETQQTRRGTDKIGLQTNSNMYTRVFTMFGSSLFLQLNKVMQSVTKLRRASVASFKSAVKGDLKGAKENFPKEKDVRALYVNLFVANVLFAAMSNIFKYNPLMDDDDDEITEEEMERIKKSQNALKRGKEVSDEDMKLIERYQFQLDKAEVLKAYENALYGMNQLSNLPLIGPSIQQNWDYYYWNNPNAFTADKKSRVVNPLEQTFTRGFWDKTLNDVSESEFVLKTIINFALGVDVKRPIAMIEVLQSYWGDDEMYREGYEELNDKGERKFKGTFEEYKAKQMEENMYELMGISYSYRPGSGKDWTKKKITITIDPKKEGEEEEKPSKSRRRRKSRRR